MVDINKVWTFTRSYFDGSHFL